MPTGQTGMGQRRVPTLLVLLLGGMALLHGALYSVVTPPWQGPDEPTVFEYVRLMGDLGRVPSQRDVSLPLQQEILKSMLANRYWDYIRLAAPAESPSSFGETPFLQTAPTQLDADPPLYFAVAALFYRPFADRPLEAQLAAVRSLSVVLGALVVILACLTAWELFPGDFVFMIATAGLALMHPMRNYVSGVANNDSLAILIGSAALYLLVRALRRGWNAAILGLLALVCAAGLWTKRNTLFIWPTLAAVGVYLAWHARRQLLRAHRTKLIVGAVVVVLILAAGWMPSDSAAGWNSWPDRNLSAQDATMARSGSRSFHVRNANPVRPACVEQFLSLWNVRRARGKTLTLQAFARTAEGQHVATIWANDGNRGEHLVFEAGPQWQTISLTLPVAPTSRWVWVDVCAGDMQYSTAGDAYFDDVTLRLPEGEDLLYNGSAEIAAPLWHAWTLPWLSYRRGNILDALGEGYLFLSEARALYLNHLRVFYESSWARFGWFYISLTDQWYFAIDLATWVAGLGLLVWGLQTWRQAEESLPGQAPAVATLAVALFSATAIAIAAFIPTLDPFAFAQGRHLLPAVAALAVLFSLGWRHLLVGVFRLQPRIFLALYLGALGTLDAASLAAIITHFWN